MQQVQTLLSASYVVPMDADNTILENTTVVIDNGRILSVMPTSSAESMYRGDEQVSLHGQLLMPGLINSHTHASMSLLRGLGSDLPLMQWLNDYVWPREQQWVSPQFVHDGTQLAIAEMLRSGITCFNDMYFFPEVTARTAIGMGMRACVGMIMLDFPSPYAKTPNEYLNKGLEMHDQFKHHPLISTIFSPHAPYTVCDESFNKIALYANELDLRIHTHLHETTDEIEGSVSQYGLRPIDRLEKLGVLNDSLIAIHTVHLTAAEIEKLAANQIHVVHCPTSNLKLASGFCPLEKLRESGVQISIGTDGSASNDSLDILSEMKIAALLAKGVSGHADTFPAPDVLRAVTLDAAKGLGLDEEIGSIEPGKAADLIAVDLQQVETRPFYDLFTQLVYSTHRENITHVWVAGRQLVKNRELTTVSKMELLHKAAEWQEKLQ